MDVSGRVQLAGGAGFTFIVGGVPMIATIPQENPWFWVGLAFTAIGALLLLAAIIAHRRETSVIGGELDHAYSRELPNGQIETITPRGAQRMARSELRMRLCDPAFERWYREDMHRRAFDALTFYQSWRGWFVLTARRIRRALTP